jgi:RNA polymerase sporulation-specific sigma factor
MTRNIKAVITEILQKMKEYLYSKRTVFYINSPQTLPPPLGIQEETQLVEEYRQGNASARDKLVEHNLRLVVYIAKKFENSGVYIEDLVSIGTIGLIKAVNTYNPEKNIKLATYASRCVENEILMHLRKVNHQRMDVSLDEPLNIDWDGNELLLSDVLGSDGLEINDNVEQEDEKRILYECMNELNNRERLIMHMRFGMCGEEEHTQKEVADELGISQSYISRLEKRIILKLKKDIERQTIEK